MSQPDEIRKFVLEHYILPARERGEDTITLSGHAIQQAMGPGIATERICRALDTRLFLDLAIVTLIRREGTPQAADARWTFGVSMRHQRGEILVAVLKYKRDLAILKGEGWYRVPVSTAPRRWPPKWIAFYQGAQWGQERGVNYYAPVKEIRRVLRRELFPNEIPSQRSDNAYFQILLGSLQELDPPLLSRRPRVIIFIPTTWQKFATAVEINDLYDDSPLEDLLWAELKKMEVPVERQWRVQVKKKHYYLDFALFCQEGKVAVETDGDLWHLGRPHSAADNRRQNALSSAGWRILRFDTHQIREEMTSYCVPEVRDIISGLKGIADEGLVSRRFYTLPEGAAQQLTLFEAEAEYDLD
jgi:very-short-patch-repair endonuclease